MISQHRYLLTEDGSEVVLEGDPRGHSLLVGKGCELPDAEAANYTFPEGPEDEATEGEVTEGASGETKQAETTGARRGNGRKAQQTPPANA